MRQLNSNVPADGEAARPGLQLGDVYYTLFRHKWKILFCALAGIAAAVVMYRQQPPLYVSRAKLLVRYIVDTKEIGPGVGDMKNPDVMGTGIINAELEILRSFDLAREVAELVGPEKILDGTNNNLTMAAVQINSGVEATAPNRGNVIFVEYKHPRAEVAKNVLTKLIEAYFRKHQEIHGASGILDEVLMKRVDELRLKIADTEEKLRKAKSSANVVSIEDTMKAHLQLISKIRTDLFGARAELAEHAAAMMRLTNDMARIATKALTETNSPAATPQPGKLDEYRRLVGQLEFLSRREQELSTQFTPSNVLVREIRVRIDEAQASKTRMELEDPTLTQAPVMSSGGAVMPDPVAAAVRQESSRIVALTAKIAELTNQLASVQMEAARVEDAEIKIRELQRQKELEENQYKSYAAGLERSRMEDSVGSGKLPNINTIQVPTPPGKDYSKLMKRLGIVAGGGLAAGLALAFLIDLLLDQSVRRPGDLLKKMQLPVFLTVPRLKRLRPTRARERKAIAGPEQNGSSPLLPALQSISATGPVVQPYCDALRDRLIHFFQKNNMTHKPKLVAVTGCATGSGVSTVAAGLAASLSETGDGNVLLVDTNVTEGAAHPFYRGKLVCGLNDVLKEDLRSGAQVQDNLYVAAASESDGALIKALPKRFGQLVPKLKASDYDYIIFDMPPVTQTSITSKLAGYMDMVLLVVESEKTGRAIVSDAADLLRDSRANIATVLNKTRRYVPRWVHREFE